MNQHGQSSLHTLRPVEPTVAPVVRRQSQTLGLGPSGLTLLLALIFAPSFSSSSAPSIQPSYAALCRGVLPACETSALAHQTLARISEFTLVGQREAAV